MEEPTQVYKKKDGIEKLEIYQEDNPISPREWDNFGVMVCFHSRYSLGDKTDLTSDMFEGWEQMEEYLRKEKHAVIILPLFLYDHSGITISTGSFNDRWDSGQVGFIYVTKEKMKEEKVTEEHARKILEGEVDTYDEYLRGNVYMYNLVEENPCDKCGCVSKEILDSCGGFYGYDPKKNGLFDNAGIKQEEWEEIK